MSKHLIVASAVIAALAVGGAILGEGAAAPAKKPAAAVPDQDEQAPAAFAVKLVTTKGDIVVDVTRDWAPKGVDRFYTLVRSGFYADVAFFRVIKGFMAQVGLHGDPKLTAKWREKRIADDPVKQSNARGTVTFATAGPDSRTTQFFINFGDNKALDKMGFAPFGKVRDMATVDALYDGYGEGAPRGAGPDQGQIQRLGNKYLKAKFPKLDYIKSAEILP